MAKAFDIVHKASSDEKQPVERVPFEPAETTEKKRKAVRKKSHIEIIFFYGLLFVVFFIIGVNFLSANAIGNLFKKPTPSPSSSAQASHSPNAGFAIESPGQTNEQAAKELGTPTPTSAATASPKSTPSTSATASTTAKAKIQILNGTNKEGAAAAMRTSLADKGIAVDNIGNNDTRDVATTTIYYKAGFEATATQIKGIVGGSTKLTTTGIGDYNILVLIGAN